MKHRNFVFIKTDNRGKTDESDRKRIRSQCMNGKNCRIGRRSTYAAEPAVAGHATSQELEQSPSRQQTIYQAPATTTDRADVRQGDLYEKLSQLDVPRAPDSDLSVLADNTDARARLHLFHFLSHARHLIYPVELCVDFDLSKSNGIRWIFEDTAYLHFTLFFSSAINDAFLRRPYGKTTCYHMGQTFASLNQKLAHSKLDDPTIAVVSSLVIVSSVFSDYSAAKTHFAGLQQIVRLRGGLEAFRHDLGLYIKLARVDLAYTLHTGENPLFINAEIIPPTQTNTVTSNPHHNEQYEDVEVDCNSSLDSLSMSASHSHLPFVIETFLNDHRVVSVFHELRHLSCRLNRQRRLHDSDFKLAICSVQYQLLMLENTLDGPISECLRLAMLVFLTTTFEIPESAGQRYPYLSVKFRESCCTILNEGSASEIWNDFAMWLLVIGGVSLYGVDEDWLREHWRRVAPVGETWDVTRSRLKRFLWLDALHDELGKEMTEALNRNDVDEKAIEKTKTSAWWLSGWGICPLEI